MEIDDDTTANLSARALAVTTELQALIALLQMIGGNYLKGAYNLRKAWKAYENLANLNKFIRDNDGNQLTILEDKAYMVSFGSLLDPHHISQPLIFLFRVTSCWDMEHSTFSAPLCQSHSSGF